MVRCARPDQKLINHMVVFVVRSHLQWNKQINLSLIRTSNFYLLPPFMYDAIVRGHLRQEYPMLS